MPTNTEPTKPTEPTESTKEPLQEALLRECGRAFRLSKHLHRERHMTFFGGSEPDFRDGAGAPSASREADFGQADPRGCGHNHHDRPGMGHDFHRLHRQFSAFRGQGRLLKMLESHDGIQVKDVAEALDIRPSSASELVSKLESRGLVRVEGNTKDRRVRQIFITEAGKDFIAKLRTMRAEQTGAIFDGLDAAEQTQLLALLRKMNDHLAKTLDLAEDEAGTTAG